MFEIRQGGMFAGILISLSLVGWIAVVLAVIWHDSHERYATVAVLAAFLPFSGALIGSVLTHYSSLSNFAMAANALKNLATPAAGASEIPVTSAMIDRDKIVGIALASQQTPASINLQRDLLSKFNPMVTRIPIFDSKDIIKFVVHESTLNKFITKVTINQPAGLTLANATLQNLLDDQELGSLPSAFVMVPSSYTLHDTKKKIDRRPSCRDAFVTQNGKSSELIMGWVTDTRVSEFSRV